MLNLKDIPKKTFLSDESLLKFYEDRDVQKRAFVKTISMCIISGVVTIALSWFMLYALYKGDHQTIGILMPIISGILGFVGAKFC